MLFRKSHLVIPSTVARLYWWLWCLLQTINLIWELVFPLPRGYILQCQWVMILFLQIIFMWHRMSRLITCFAGQSVVEGLIANTCHCQSKRPLTDVFDKPSMQYTGNLWGAWLTWLCTSSCSCIDIITIFPYFNQVDGVTFTIDIECNQVVLSYNKFRCLTLTL